MNILFLSINFKVEVSGIYTDLMQELKIRGHNIYSVSTTERRNGISTFTKFENGINILKIKTLNIQKVNKIEKGIATLLLESQFINGIKKYYGDIKFDLIINATPPITFEKVIRYIKARDGSINYLLLKDIFPQNAIDLGMMSEKSLIYKVFRKKEEKLYKIADYIGCMSDRNKTYILEHNPEINESKVEVCPNSIKPKSIIRLSEEEKSELKEKLNINKSALTIIYGGNLGKPQGIDFLIDIINSNKDRNDVHFLIIGNGTEFSKLESFLNELKPQNTTLKAYLPKNEYEKFVNVADVGLILLDRNFTIPNFPSRILSYMEYSLPVIAATDVNTDIGECILKGNFGYWCESGNIDEFNKIINKVIKDKEKIIEMGMSSREYLENNFTVDISADIILEKFKK